MLLKQPRQRVKISCTGMRSQRSPFRRSVARGLDSCVDVRGRALGNRGQDFTARGIDRLEIFAVSRPLKFATDKGAEAALVAVEPGRSFFRVLGSRTVFHGHKLFGNGHKVLPAPSYQSRAAHWLDSNAGTRKLMNRETSARFSAFVVVDRLEQLD